MKRSIWLLALTLWAVCGAQAQEEPQEKRNLSEPLCYSDVPHLLEECREEIAAINDMPLRRVYMGQSGYSLTNDYYAGDYALYFDAQGRLRKTWREIDYPEAIGVFLHYYDEGGTVIGAVGWLSSAMSLGISAVRYNTPEGEMLYTDIIWRNDLDGLPAGSAVMWGGYTEVPTPVSGVWLFDLGDDRESDERPETFAPPAEYTRVRFGLGKGDTTIVNANNVSLRSRADGGDVLAVLNVGDRVKVERVEGEACRISYTEYGKPAVSGYVDAQALEPAERLITP